MQNLPSKRHHQTGAVASKPGLVCPLITNQCIAPEEHGNPEAELRAYKLGKQRWLYNECQVHFQQENGPLRLGIQEAHRQGTSGISEHFQECGVSYTARLTNGTSLDLEVYVVYDMPEPTDGGDNRLQSPLQAAMAPLQGFHWIPVQRSDCTKGCKGPILRAIQRFGRVSRRSGRKSGSPPQDKGEDKAKESRHLYLAIDEAGTHVGVKRFRLVAGAMDENKILLGTAVSAPISVLANNDAPFGPAVIHLHLTLNHAWEGWGIVAEKGLEGEQVASYANPSELSQSNFDTSALLEQDSASRMDSVESCRARLGNSGFSRLGSIPAGPVNWAEADLTGGHLPQLLLQHALTSANESQWSVHNPDGSIPDAETPSGGLPPAKRHASRKLSEDQASTPIPSFFEMAEANFAAAMRNESLGSLSRYAHDALRLESLDNSSLESSSMQLQLTETPLELGAYRHSSAPDAQQQMRMNSLPDTIVGGLRKSNQPEAGALRHNSMYTFGGPGYHSMQYSGSGSTNSDLSATDRTALTDRYFWAHQMVDIQGGQWPQGQGSAAQQGSNAGPGSKAAPGTGFPWNKDFTQNPIQNPNLLPLMYPNGEPIPMVPNPFAMPAQTGDGRSQQQFPWSASSAPASQPLDPFSRGVHEGQRSNA